MIRACSVQVEAARFTSPRRGEVGSRFRDPGEGAPTSIHGPNPLTRRFAATSPHWGEVKRGCDNYVINALVLLPVEVSKVLKSDRLLVFAFAKMGGEGVQPDRSVLLVSHNRIAARVEGKSSFARLGLGIHVMAPASMLALTDRSGWK